MYRTGIYEIRNTVNGKRYVGSAVDFGNRWRQHAQSLERGDHHCIALQRAWNMYTPRAFQFNKLLACDRHNLLVYEQIYFERYQPEYNSSKVAGSRLGLKMSDASREKMRASRRKDFSPMTGKQHTEATRAKISAAKKGVPTVPCSEEKKAKLSAIHKGRVITAEQRSKISATLMGHKQSAEQIEKRKQTFRAIGFSEKLARLRAKLTDDQVRAIRLSLAAGEKQKAIAAMHGVDRSVISEINTRTTYAWVI